MKKVGGYIVSIAGFAIVALGIKPIYESISKNFTPIAQISANMLLIIGLIVLGVGVFLARAGSGFSHRKQPSEVPIYHGKHVVGYRRQ